MTTPELITVAEAMNALRISRQTLYNLLDAGKLDSVKLGGKRMFTREQLNKYVRSCVQKAANR